MCHNTTIVRKQTVILAIKLQAGRLPRPADGAAPRNSCTIYDFL